AARHRLAIGEAEAEDALFLPYGAPGQEEARISAEELKAALEGDHARRPMLLDLCCPGTCHGAPTCWLAPPCTRLARCRAGSRRCRAAGRSWSIAFAAFRSAAAP